MNEQTPKPPEAPRIQHELESLKSYLTAAHDVVNSGHMPELSGLDLRIAELCEKIQAAAPELQQTCLPELFKLIEQLNTCEKAMRESPMGRAAGKAVDANATEGKKT